MEGKSRDKGASCAGVCQECVCLGEGGGERGDLYEGVSFDSCGRVCGQTSVQMYETQTKMHSYLIFDRLVYAHDSRQSANASAPA